MQETLVLDAGRAKNMQWKMKPWIGLQKRLVFVFIIVIISHNSALFWIRIYALIELIMILQKSSSLLAALGLNSAETLD